MINPRTTRRLAALVAGAVSLALLSGCATSPASDEKVTLRFAWWGSDVRQKITQRVIDAFESENPNITIKGESGDFNGYWDKLATQVAANDAPDIIQMDPGYISEYAGRGALLDLSKVDIDTSDFDDAVLGTGKFDGGLWGIINGVNVPVLFANPALFEQAGVPLPDDSTWTWDDYDRIAAEITKNTPDGIYGSESIGTDPTTLEMWLRQHGKSLFTNDGKLGFSAKDAEKYYDFLQQLSASKAIPPGSLVEENSGATLNERANASGKAALGWWFTNQLPAVEAASGTEMKVLRYPSVKGEAKSAGQYIRASQYWTVSSRTKHSNEAAKFVDFLANSPKAANIMLTERGTIPNSKLNAAVADSLVDSDRAVADFVTSISDELSAAPPATPVGLGSGGLPLGRYTSEVLFDRMTPAAAAKGLIDESNGNLRQ